MISAAEFFSKYDALQKTASDAEREAWLISQCEMANPEGPQEQRVLSTMYNELGSFYKHRDMLEKGEEAFLKAKELWETSEKDANYATIINNLAGNYRMMGKFSEATELFEEAIELYKAHPETPKELSSSAYNNLALVYLDTGRFKEAAEMLQAAYDAMKDIPDCYYEKATANANMAIAYYKCGETDLVDEKMRIAEDLYLSGGLENTAEYRAFTQLKEILKKS